MIYVVTGLPRSGTSLVMQMLYSGGLPVYADDSREADEHNERGYFEHPDVDNIREDNSFLKNCEGKAVKIVAHRMYWIDHDLNYRIIYVDRNPYSVAKSQRNMILNKGKTPKVTDISLVRRYRSFKSRFFEDFSDWKIFTVDYDDILYRPLRNAILIKQFLMNILSTDKMVNTIEPRLKHE